MVSVITGVGAIAVYAKLQQATPVSTNIQMGVGGASALFSTIYIMDTHPHPRMSFPKALTLGTGVAGCFYCLGGAVGAGISVLSNNNNNNKSRHEDV